MKKDENSFDVVLGRARKLAEFSHPNWVRELGRPASTGIYLYRIQAGNPPLHSGQVFTQTHRMLLLK